MDLIAKCYIKLDEYDQAIYILDQIEEKNEGEKYAKQHGLYREFETYYLSIGDIKKSLVFSSKLIKKY